MFRRVFKIGIANFSRERGLAAAAIFILTLTTLLIGSLFLFQNASKVLTSALQEKVDVSVYFKEDAAEDEIQILSQKIDQIPEVKESRFVSKEQALEDFTRRYANDETLIAAVKEVGGNPFLASLNIKTLAASQYEALASFLERPEFENIINKIDYHQRRPVIERVFSLTSATNRIGLILSLVLAIIAVLVVFNTVRLAIYNFKEEIKIQRLVGASNWFIRGPFLVQGFISGAVSSLISLVIIFSIAWSLSPKFQLLFQDLNIFQIFVSDFWRLLLIQLVSGISLGVISSLVAVRKYLKV